MALQQKSAGDSATPGSVATTGTSSLDQARDARPAGAFSLIAPQGWRRQATAALIEAQVMSESIHALATLLIEGSDKDSFPLLEAIVACVHRVNAAVDPVIAKAQQGEEVRS